MNTLPQILQIVFAKICSWLSHSSVPFIAVILAVGLTLPSLWNGFARDDYVHRTILLSDTPMSARFMSALNLFCFVSGETPWKARSGQNLGVVPWWWLTEGGKLCFFRPLTSITHWLDYQFWPDSPLLMHLQSLAWFAMLVFFVSFLYRRILDVKWSAGLAALFFAVDPAHGTPAGWLANRNALLAGVFGVLCLIVHDNWKQAGWKPGFMLGPLCFLLALLSAEAGIAIGAYLLSYTLFLEQGPVRKRLISLIPYALIFLPWALTYVSLGCGAYNTGFYTDPLHEPLLYLKAIFFRAPVYLLGQWTLPVWNYYINWPSTVYRAGIGFAALLIVVLIPCIRKDKTAQFWALGMFLSLLPICAVIPQERNLLFVGLGTMGLLAQWMCWMFRSGWRAPSRLKHLTTRIVVVIFIVINAFIHPMLLPGSSRMAALIEQQVEKAARSLPFVSETETRMFILADNPMHFLFVAGVIDRLMSQGEFTPVLALSAGKHSLTYVRKDLHTLDVQSKNGSLTDLDNFLLGKEFAMEPGHTVRLHDVVIEVLEVSKGLPSRAQFRFRVPIDDPGLLWFRWENGTNVPFTPPGVGETLTIEGPSFTIG